MSPELDNKLCSKYPELFQDRNGSPQNTAMCWGFECADGWFSLIESICEYLMGDVNRLKDRIQSVYYKDEERDAMRLELAEAEKNIPVVMQVKEKFGGLRFYVHGATEKQFDYIYFAEHLSYKVCEDCGTMKDVMSYDISWIRTLCPEHADKQYGEAAEQYRSGKYDKF
jgi:hypothetical protein